ncbi:MAG: hypothetical protein Q8P41_24040 [Pseudomonadota bacterium]|nr:hypothetical protein [Pseudomonadota bacterium]
MSDRGRSRLFGRPGELLVDEQAPRINMPSPPVRMRAPDERAEAALLGPDPAEEDALPTRGGPLQVFVGKPPGETQARRTGDTLPGALMSDAMDQLGDAFGRRAAPPRAQSPAPPPPGVRVAARGTASPRPPEPPAALPPSTTQRARAPGIATAAARVRGNDPRVDLVPPNLYADEERTNIEASTPQGFDGLRPPDRGDARSSEPSPWVDLRPTRPAAQDFNDMRIPPRSADFDTGGHEQTDNGERMVPFGELTPTGVKPGTAFPGLVAVAAPLTTPPPPAPPFAPAPPLAAAPSPAAPVTPLSIASTLPRPAPKRSAPRLRRSMIAAAAVLVLVAGVGAWRWQQTRPGMAVGPRNAVASVTAVAESLAPEKKVALPETPTGATADPALVVPPVADPAPSDVPAVVPPVEVPPAPIPIAAEPVPVVAPPIPAPAPAPVVLPPRAATPLPAAPTTPNVEERRGNLQAATGVLQVICNRKATIYVNNVKMGTTADSRPVELTAGTHRVKVVGSNGRSRSMDVRIDAGRPSMVKFEL